MIEHLTGYGKQAYDTGKVFVGQTREHIRSPIPARVAFMVAQDKFADLIALWKKCKNLKMNRRKVGGAGCSERHFIAVSYKTAMLAELPTTPELLAAVKVNK